MAVKYPKYVREFALGLHYHSPRAYEYIREVFGKNLPHESTLRRWYSNSDLNVKPGITAKSLEYLKRKADAKKSVQQELLCAVCFDEMSIRKQVVWSQHLGQMQGYVTYGCNDKDDPLIAKEAIVFIVSGLNEKFRIPVAYHFINSLNSIDKTELVKDVLRALFEANVIVTSITFDGHPTNKRMCQLLGANLFVLNNDFQTFFILDGQYKIYILFDICHTEKLVRGQIDKKSILIDENEQKIKWDYIAQLVKFSQGNSFSFTHKLNQSHLEWRRRPMNVRIAVETLSKSTAESIEFLRLKGYREFADSSATIRFIEIFNVIFDVFNTKSLTNNENIFKIAVNNTNKDAIFQLFNEATTYIKNLKYKGDAGEIKNICRSEVKTGFVGTIINMHSLRQMYEDYVEQRKLLSFIPTYYLNQDGVEMFFGKVRSLGGFNDNPNTIQFQAAYRKLLGCDSILLSKRGNCEVFNSNSNPFSDILHVSSKRDKFHEENEEEVELIVASEVDILYEKLSDLSQSGESSLTDDINSYSMAHIASIIEARIKSTENCEACIKVFDECKKAGNVFRVKQSPCVSTYNICKEADRFIRLELLKGNINFKTIYYSIINNIPVEQLYEEADFSRHAEHNFFLIRAVIDLYIHMKGTFIARNATKELHSKLVRHKFRKLIHFFGQ